MVAKLWCVAVASFSLCCASSPIQPQDSSAVLKSLAEQAKEYQRTIPNFTCSEVVTTTAKRGNKLLRRIEFQADIQVRRKADRSLEETFLITTYMGKPRPANTKLLLLLYVEGGLGEGMPSFFDESTQVCYDYRGSSGRIDFNANNGKGALCHESKTTGFASLDAQGKLLHGEIRTPPEEANRSHHPVFAAIDYADVRLDDRLFRMPIHTYAETLQDGLLRTFDAYYTSCKLFAAKTTIRPGDGTDPPAP